MKRLITKSYFPIILAPFILFAPLIFTGKALFWGTASTQFIPWWDFAWDTMLQGQFPLWNPWVGMGAPLVANYQSALFYPPYWFLFIVYALAGLKWMSWSLTFVVVFHLVWSGLGIAKLLEEMGYGILSQTIGGLAFSLSGYLVARAGFLSINAATAWLPWILLFSLRISQKNKNATWMLAITIAFLLLAGHAQTAWYSIMLSIVWILFWSIKNSVAENKISHVWQIIKKFILAGILGAGISAVQLIPTAEYLIQSQRSGEYGFTEAMTYSFWPWRFLTLFVPGLFGNPAVGNYWGYGNYWEDAVYIGLLPILMALGLLARAILRKNNNNGNQSKGYDRDLVIFLGVIICLSFLLALGDNAFLFPFLYKNIPTFGLFQAPTRFSLWAEIAFSVLAGIGVNQLVRPEGKRKYWIRLAAAGCVAIMGGSALGWIFLSDVNASFFIPLGIAGLLGFCTTLLVLFQPRREQIRNCKIWGGLVAVIVIIDLLVAGWGLNPGVDISFYDIEKGNIRGIRSFIPADQEYDLKFNKYFRFDTFESEADWAGMHYDLLPNLPMLQGIEMVNNFDPLVPARYQLWIDEYNRLNDREHHQMTGLMNIGYVISDNGNRIQVSEYGETETNEEVSINTLEMISENDDEVLANIINGDFDLHKNVILSLAPSLAGTDCTGQSSGEIRIIDRAPGYLNIETELKNSSWVVWSQSWYPGWKAVIDEDQEVSVERANYLFQAVCVPSGEHTVEIIYRPLSFYLGAGLTLLSLGIVIGLVVLNKKENNPSN